MNGSLNPDFSGGRSNKDGVSESVGQENKTNKNYNNYAETPLFEKNQKNVFQH
jgi:hypothetical protein